MRIQQFGWGLLQLLALLLTAWCQHAAADSWPMRRAAQQTLGAAELSLSFGSKEQGTTSDAAWDVPFADSPAQASPADPIGSSLVPVSSPTVTLQPTASAQLGAVSQAVCLALDGAFDAVMDLYKVRAQFDWLQGPRLFGMWATCTHCQLPRGARDQRCRPTCCCYLVCRKKRRSQCCRLPLSRSSKQMSASSQKR